MEKATKGLVLIAGVLFLAACGGSSSPATPSATPPQQPSPPPPPPPLPPPPPPPPKETTIAFSANPTLVAPGAATELRWSSPNAEHCTALGAWSGTRATGGREISYVIIEATEFRLRCEGPDGIAERTARVEPEPPLRITDKYGRTLGGDRELVLVDWEGQMANPAIEFYLHPTERLALPATVLIQTDHPRLYLDNPRSGTETGAQRTIKLESGEPVLARISSFSDDDTTDGDHQLHIKATGAGGETAEWSIRVREIDHDRARPFDFPVTVDFAQDTEGYFDSEKKRGLMRKALENWAYFIADMELDTVSAGSEKTTLWHSHPTGFVDSYQVSNGSEYNGFLLYAQGITSGARRSGGDASKHAFQASRGTELPLRRSGSVQIEVEGEYRVPGWFLSDGADDAWHPWWETADLLHTAQHEIGHAMIFSDALPNAKTFRESRQVTDERVRAYFGAYPSVDRNLHLHDAIDPESLKGAFGNHLGGPMLTRRWMITKLDLLVAQAIGYKLRPTSAFRALAVTTASALPGGYAALPYAAPIEAVGGIPFYHWTVAVGALPEGLELDAFDGVLYGTPSETGTFEFTVEVEEYGGQTMTRTITLEIT
ncbi:MAG: Ig domain-containing protein [Gammaproteobacteria bacterium]